MPTDGGMVSLFVQIKPGAPPLRVMAVKKIISLYCINKRVSEYIDGTLYEAETTPAMARRMDKELRPYKDIITLEFDPRGKGGRKDVTKPV